jgi:hypothetical protein
MNALAIICGVGKLLISLFPPNVIGWNVTGVAVYCVRYSPNPTDATSLSWNTSYKKYHIETIIIADTNTFIINIVVEYVKISVRIAIGFKKKYLFDKNSVLVPVTQSFGKCVGSAKCLIPGDRWGATV